MDLKELEYVGSGGDLSTTTLKTTVFNNVDPVSRTSVLSNMIKKIKNHKLVDNYSYTLYTAACRCIKTTPKTRTTINYLYNRWMKECCVYKSQINPTLQIDLIEGKYSTIIDLMSGVIEHHGSMTVVCNANVGKGSCDEITDLVLNNVGIGPIGKLSSCKACANFVSLLCAAHNKFCEILHDGDLKPLDQYIAELSDDSKSSTGLFKPLNIVNAKILVEIARDFKTDDYLEKQEQEAKKMMRRLNRMCLSEAKGENSRRYKEEDLFKLMVQKFINKSMNTMQQFGLEQADTYIPVFSALAKKYILKKQHMFAGVKIKNNFSSDTRNELKILNCSEFEEFTS